MSIEDSPPDVWLLVGHKEGDNAQVLALAEGLGWPYEIKRMAYRPYELMTNRLLGPNLFGVAVSRSSELAPPWPDLVITAGRRNEPIARWVRKRSGNKTRLVLIGRPWAVPEHFDLIVTTPQYDLPAGPNILLNDMPLHRVSEAGLRQAGAAWQGRLAHLPRPYIALLIGGNSGAFTFDPDRGRRLGRQASAMAEEAGGSLLVTSSARTPEASMRALKSQLSVPTFLFEWDRFAAQNPYYAYLALADAFVVTSDSMSMLTEACSVKKPVYLFDMGDGTDSRWWSNPHNWRFKALTHRLAMRVGPARMKRDVGRIHRRLIEQGRVVWLGEKFAPNFKPVNLDDLQRAVARVKALF